MAKAQLQILRRNGCYVKQFVDGTNKQYARLADILMRLRQYRTGMQIEVYNDKYAHYISKPTEMFYLVFSDKGSVDLLYVDLRRKVSDIIGSYYYKNSKRNELDIHFTNNLEKVYGKLTIIHDGALNQPVRQAYCVLYNPDWQLVCSQNNVTYLKTDKTTIAVENGKVKIPEDAMKYKVAQKYRNENGEIVSKYWMTLSHAVFRAINLAYTCEGIYLVCSRDNVLFAVRK